MLIKKIIRSDINNLFINPMSLNDPMNEGVREKIKEGAKILILPSNNPNSRFLKYNTSLKYLPWSPNTIQCIRGPLRKNGKDEVINKSKKNFLFISNLK